MPPARRKARQEAQGAQRSDLLHLQDGERPPVQGLDRADNLKDALHELDRFMVDPEGYRSPAERRPAHALPILLNAETAAQFLRWSWDEKKNCASSGSWRP